ncbi:MAG: YbhN family protein [Gammaproteobacteria bacterium]
MRLRYGILIALGLGLGIGIPLFLGGHDLLPLLDQVSAGELMLLLGMIFIGWNLNAGRLRLLAGGAGLRLGQGQALATVMATEFAICATPAGSGGPITYAWLLRRHGLDTPRALALYAADQLMDMLFFLTALGALLLHWLMVPEDWHLAWQAGLMGGFLLTALTLLGFSLHHYRTLFLALGRLLRRLRVGPENRRHLARRALEFRRSLRLVQGYSRSRLTVVYMLCTAHWLLRYSILYLAVRALGGGISWIYAFLVQMLSLTAGQATLLPGGSGGAEASSSLLLAPYLDSATSAAAILVWRFVTFYWYLIAGAPVFAAVAGRALWKRLWTRPAA